MPFHNAHIEEFHRLVSQCSEGLQRTIYRNCTEMLDKANAGKDRETFDLCLGSLRATPVSIAFIITALVNALDDHFRAKFELIVRVEQARLADLEIKARQDAIQNPGGESDRLKMAEFIHGQALNVAENIEKDKRTYEEWRKVFGDRAQQSNLGVWLDVMRPFIP